MALQYHNNQKHIDNAVPTFFGDPTSTLVSEANMRTMMNQTKNQKQVREVFVHLGVTEVNSSHPLLMLVMDHGASPAIDTDRWQISCTAPKETQSHDTAIHKHHYCFVTHRCDPDTYAVIPKSADPLYSSILAETSTM